MNQPYLGIAFCTTKGNPPFAESAFFRELSMYGRIHDVPVFVFCPRNIDFESETVPGYAYNEDTRKWEMRRFPLPNAVYDRCFYIGPEHLQSYKPHIRRLQELGIPFLGHGLKGKWQVYEILNKSERFKPYIPQTDIVYRADGVVQSLRHGQTIVLKPQAGSQGKSIYRISVSDQQINLKGRDARNRIFHKTIPYGLFLKWLHKNVQRGRFIMQPYLNLTTSDGRAFDVRSLVQKDEEGQWSVTGMAVRCGKPESLTSNLHGGGDVYSAEPFIHQEFGTEATSIIEEMKQLSVEICSFIEAHHGRLVEVGVDFGVDRDGAIWLLEANSKPGRNVFRVIRDPISRRASVERVILYAKKLLGVKKGV